MSSSMKAHLYGKNAVVIEIYVETGTFNGRPYNRRERFTDTWVNVIDS